MLGEFHLPVYFQVVLLVMGFTASQLMFQFISSKYVLIVQR
jgi:hypothetical protein